MIQAWFFEIQMCLSHQLPFCAWEKFPQRCLILTQQIQSTLFLLPLRPHHVGVLRPVLLDSCFCDFYNISSFFLYYVQILQLDRILQARFLKCAVYVKMTHHNHQFQFDYIYKKASSWLQAVDVSQVLL